MKVIIDKKEINVDRIKVFDKDGHPYRIKQDIQHGIEIQSDGLFGTMYNVY